MVIRRTPDDFVVEEVLTAEAAAGVGELPGPKRRVAALRLTKRSLSTPEAAGRLAKMLGVKPGDVSYAGLKDKHAQTSQVVTVASIRDPIRMPREVGQLGTDNLHAALIGWTDGHSGASWIECNRFRIVIRGLDRDDVGSMVRAIEELRDPEDRTRLILLNEFGEQRFGSVRHGQGFAGPALIAGDFEGAVRLLIGTPARKDSGARRGLTRAVAEKWGSWSEVLSVAPKCPERRAIEALSAGLGFRAAFQALPELTQTMAVEAYQSWLWNRVAQRFVGDVPREARGSIGHVSIPTLGPGVQLAEPWDAAARAVLAEERLEPESMRIPGLRRPAFGVVERPLFMRVSEWDLTEPFADELAPPRSTKPLALRVCFTLRRGSYATVVLRAIGC